MNKNSSNLLSQNREMEELATKRNLINEKLESSIKTADETKMTLEKMESELNEASQKIHSIELSLNNSQNEQEHIEKK